MTKRILVIHESRVLRIILVAYLNTEIGEAEVVTATSNEEGLERIRTEHFDLVLSGLEGSGMNALDLKLELDDLADKKNLPMVVVTSIGTREQRKRLAEAGVEHYLVSPFNSLDLRKMVEAAMDPRSKRGATRYSIPGAKALLDLGDYHEVGLVINFSKGGLLCDLSHPNPGCALLSIARITLQFPPEYGEAQARDIEAVLTRLNVVTRDARQIPTQVRTAWRFSNAPDHALRTLQMAGSQAQRELEQAARTADEDPRD